MYNEGISKEAACSTWRRAGGRPQVGRLLLVRRDAVGQGRENAKDFLRKNTEMRDEIERQIREQTLAARNPVIIPVGVENGKGSEDELEDAF